MRQERDNWPYKQGVPFGRRLSGWLGLVREPVIGEHGSREELVEELSDRKAAPQVETLEEQRPSRSWLQIYNWYDRASPGQYWGFIGLVVFLTPFISFVWASVPLPIMTEIGAGIMIWFWVLVWAAILTMTIRRYHDTGRRAWALPFMFTNPITILLFVSRLFQPSEPYHNKFGPVP